MRCADVGQLTDGYVGSREWDGKRGLKTQALSNLLLYFVNSIEAILNMAGTKRKSKASSSPAAKRQQTEPTTTHQDEKTGPERINGKKQILLNAFDMSTVGHLSPGQWKVSLPKFC